MGSSAHDRRSGAPWLGPIGALLAAALLTSFAGAAMAQEGQGPQPRQAPPSRGPVASRDVQLLVGEQISIPADGVASYSEGISGIVDVRLTGDQSRFVIVALSEGVTSLLLIMEDGSQVRHNVTVRGRERAGRVEQRDNVRLDFYFVQLSESYAHRIGIGWPGSIGGTATLSGRADLMVPEISSASAVVASQVLPRLDLAQSTGWARILRQASVVTANGSEATFSSGGEVNIPVQGALTAEIRSIEFGSGIKVLPRYDRESGRIEVEIAADVSDLTSDNGTGVPGRTVSHLQTIVNLELGQSIVLAGLLARSESHSRSGLPVLSQIPIIGLLFGTDGETSQADDVLLFIVPSVVDAVPLTERDRIREAFEVYQAFDGDLSEVELVEPPATRRAGGRR